MTNRSTTHQVVVLALLDKVLSLLGVLDNVPGHPCCEEPPRYELGESIERQVGKEARIGEVILVPVVRVHLLLLILRLLVL